MRGVAHSGCSAGATPNEIACFGGSFALRLVPQGAPPSAGWMHAKVRMREPAGELMLSAQGPALPPHSQHTALQSGGDGNAYVAEYFYAPGTEQLWLLGHARAGARLHLEAVTLREQGSHEARARQRAQRLLDGARDTAGLQRNAGKLWHHLRQGSLRKVVNAVRSGGVAPGAQGAYAAWVARNDALSASDLETMQARIAKMRQPPAFSLVVPCYNTPAELLRACIDSVERQTYPHWQLCLCDDASTEPHVAEMLDAAAAREPRIVVVHRKENGHISRASNDALALASKPWVALLDHDDELAPHALYMVATAIEDNPEAGLVYSDEDKLDGSGRRCDPYFKPSYNPDLLRGQNYISHFGVYRRDLVAAVGGFRPAFNGSQDYDLVLRVTELLQPHQVVHVPHVLYHWRMVPGSAALGPESKPYAYVAAELALQEHLERTGRNARVRPSVFPGQFHVKFAVDARAPKVSIVVPTRDNVAVLDRCIETLRAHTTYGNYELVVVDNDGRTERSRRYMAQLERKPGVRVLRYPHPFNYAAINNWAVRQCDGEIICLLNDDTETIDADWLEELVGQAMRPEVAAVGAKLLFANRTVQHAGIVLGMGGVAAHVFRGVAQDEPGYFCRARLTHNVTAVTGAALAIRRATFLEVGGFDEQLAVAYNDVDLCLRLVRAGYDNVFTPHARLVHHESVSRGSDERVHRPGFRGEVERMLALWQDVVANDPNYSPNLSLTRTDYAMADVPRRAHRFALRPKFARARRQASAAAHGGPEVVRRGDTGEVRDVCRVAPTRRAGAFSNPRSAPVPT